MNTLLATTRQHGRDSTTSPYNGATLYDTEPNDKALLETQKNIICSLVNDAVRLWNQPWEGREAGAANGDAVSLQTVLSP